MCLEFLLNRDHKDVTSITKQKKIQFQFPVRYRKMLVQTYFSNISCFLNVKIGKLLF